MPELTVVYEAGVFRPITPLVLPEGQQLQIRIVEPKSLATSLMQALNPLVQSGALTLPIRPAEVPISETTLAPESEADECESYGVEQASNNVLSDSIIEDRGVL